MKKYARLHILQYKITDVNNYFAKYNILQNILNLY